MRGPIVAVLTACLLGAGATVVAAEEPRLIPESAGQRIEVPEAGMALTVPEGWDVRVRMQEMEIEQPPGFQGLLSRVLNVRSSEKSSAWSVLEAWNTAEYPEPGSGGCQLALVREHDSIPGTVTLADIVASDAWAFWNDAGFEGTHSTSGIVLPAGEANRVDVIEHDHDGDWYAGVYRLAVPDGLVWLMCMGFEARPDDGWLSVAHTLEFLPAGPIPATPYEIAFPDDWVVREATSSDARRMLRGFAPDQRPLVRVRLVAGPPSQQDECRLFDESVLVRERTRYGRVEDALADDVIAAQAHPRQAATDSAVVDLPSGRAARVDLLHENWLAFSRYHFTDGSAWYYLQCAASDPPADRWLSIAKTFEFVPD